MKFNRAVVLLILSILFAPNVQSESLTKFKITDYIPEKFEDFQLFIDGNGRWESNNSESPIRYLDGESEFRRTKF